MALRDAGSGQICMGEVRGRAPDGFDFGNSSFEILAVDLHGKAIAPPSSAGTRESSRAQTEPYGFMRPPWSGQRRPFAPFCRAHPIRFR
jgi:2-phosphosulfolactate phosphatase